ncbi:MAG: TrkH family potassium uptake protein [Polyangiaceae bacterium]|jgi:trk system potassium uptake protein TrkH|nr:TrkH family potassium uptake protein [Polyangiaceae bacterium]
MSRWTSFWKGTGRHVGAVIIGIGLAMVVCAAVGFAMSMLDRGARADAELKQGAALLGAALLTMLCGAGLRWYGRSGEVASMTRREAIFAVAVIWIAAGVFGSLPFAFATSMSLADGIFETISGFTTTGATVIENIEQSIERPLLLWRSVIQWLGGMGIVVLFVAIFPNVGVGAKFMFRREAPGAISEGLQPRIADTSSILWRIYVLLTASEIGLLWALGMSPFEAICHGFTTMATGGFSTRDASIAAFNSAAIEMVVAFFMLLAGINFNVYYAAIRGRTPRAFLRSVEFRVYLALILGSTLLLTINILGVHGGSPLKAARYAVFQVATFITSTGYGTDDYMLYPSPGLAIVLLLMFVGGCSGSTAGGIKVERVVLLAKTGLAQIRATFRPNVVQVIRMDRKPVPASVLNDVAVFFGVFMACLAGCVLAVAYLDGVPPQAAFGATLTCLSNMGPAPFHVGPDNFAAYSQPSKLVFSLAMVLGRLEFFTVFALFIPDFWKR